jgi:glycosyltransferase involved in cell wall biosynthesis
MKDLVILVPSRGRPQNIEDLLFSLQETKTASELIVIVDDDDETLDQYIELGCKVMMIAKQGKGMARPLNFAANVFKDDYRHFAFIGDDHRPRTEYWDQKLIDALDGVGTGVAYGNDLLQGENLPTAVAMSGDIVRALKGMVPPGFIHLYLDNFWMQLGKDLKSFIYLPDVIIEHLHPVAGKAEWDENYRSVNTKEVYSADAKAFDEYIKIEDYQDLLKALL